MGLVVLLGVGVVFCVVVQLVAAKPTTNSPERHAPNLRCALNGKFLLFSVVHPLSIKRMRFSRIFSKFQAATQSNLPMTFFKGGWTVYSDSLFFPMVYCRRAHFETRPGTEIAQGKPVPAGSE